MSTTINARKNLMDLIELGKDAGVKRIKVGSMEVEFFDKPHAPQVELPDPETILPKMSDLDNMPSDEELLLWSTNYYDQVLAAREEANKPEPPVNGI